MKRNKLSLLVILSLAITFIFNVSRQVAAEDVTVVRVGIGNAAPPFTYLNEDGEPAGYDYELLKRVDEKLEEYEFEYQPMEFAALLTAIESGQVDIGSHNISKNEEREKIYIFSEDPTLNMGYHIISLASREDFQPETWDDLAGMNVYSKIGSEDALLIQTYNEENDPDIEVTLGDQGDDVVAQSLINGETDAKISSIAQANIMNDNFDNQFRVSKNALFDQYGYFAYPKGNEELRDAIDEALDELREEGVLDELYEEYIVEFLN